MDKNSNSFVMAFSVGMCVVLAVLLSGTFNLLKDTVSANIQFDRQLNVLIATGLHDPFDASKAKTRAELEQLYADNIEAKVLIVHREMQTEEVRKAGELVEEQVERVVDMEVTDRSVEELPNLRLEESRKPNKAERIEYTTFYTRSHVEGGERRVDSYCIPIEGLGLWGMIYGFLALESDLETVRGITFYQHKETPGLGGEIDKEWWQDQWPGKRVVDADGKLVGVTVKKGKVDPTVAVEKERYVDGLSGATITSNGVTNFVRDDLEAYQALFKKLRSE